MYEKKRGEGKIFYRCYVKVINILNTGQVEVRSNKNWIDFSIKLF